MTGHDMVSRDRIWQIMVWSGKGRIWYGMVETGYGKVW